VSDSPPDLHMLNLVVTDMAASLDFYRRLGVAVTGGQDTAGARVQLRMPGGFSFELDTAESARLWHAGWRADPAGVSVVVGFSLPTREAVDQRYAELTAAGYPGRQPPFDAFWGARYAIVADPDGNDVGCVAVAVALRMLPAARGRAARLDPVGAAAVTAVMVLILVPLAVGREQGWPIWMWICLAAAVLATPVLLAWQAAAGRRGAEPIINTRLFTNQRYTLLLVACSLFQLYFGCFMFTLSLLLQAGLGESAVAASAMFFCQGVLFTATSLRSGRLAVRLGRRVPVIGAGLVVIGLIALAVVLAADPPGMVELIAALGVVGAGNGSSCHRCSALRLPGWEPRTPERRAARSTRPSSSPTHSVSR
jgi:catechol 2,3-dioxygenase-like lactoylglutathione lyase family enzyme